MTKKQKAKRRLILLSAGFLVSLFLLLFTLVWPIYKAIQSRNWPEVECIVDYYHVPNAGILQTKQGNRVQSKTDIQYSYQYQGEWYTSGGSSRDQGLSHSRAKSSVVSKNAICYVNPENPSEALFFNRFNFYFLYLSLLPAIILIACAYGFYRCLITLRKDTANPDLSGNIR